MEKAYMPIGTGCEGFLKLLIPDVGYKNIGNICQGKDADKKKSPVNYRARSENKNTSQAISKYSKTLSYFSVTGNSISSPVLKLSEL